MPIAPNPGRPLAPAPLNVQRIVATSKRSVTTTTTTAKKRYSKTIIDQHNEIINQQNSSPINSFAESISGLMQNFDQELMASNFLSPQSVVPPATTNILSNDSTASSPSNINIIRTLDNVDIRQIVNTTIQRNDPYQSMPTLDEFNDRLDHDTNQAIQDYNVDNEQITSLMNDEDMHFVEMNFDENTFLKQFDLVDDPTSKLNTHPEQNIFNSLLSNNHQLNNSIEQSNLPLPSHPVYPGSSLIKNNIFTTVVPLGLQQQSSQTNAFNNNNNNNHTLKCLPEEGVQLT